MLIDGRKDWPSGDKLDQDATKGPHIDCLIIWKTQDNLRAAIVPALHIDKATFELSASRSKVNNLHGLAAFVRKQDILWLKITVDYREFRQMVKTF